MQYFKLVLVILYVHFGLVTLLRTMQKTGSGQWHHNMYDGVSSPFIDWWWVLIPSMIIVALFAGYTSARTQRVVFWLFTGFVVFLIGGTYL